MSEELSKEEIHMMLHCLGIEYNQRTGKKIEPKKRYRPIPKTYRNHYQIEKCDIWDGLVSKAFAKKGKALGMNFYYVNYYGINKLKDIGYIFDAGELENE